MIKAILFDFDGTIADTLPAIREGVNLAMEKYGYPQHDEAAILTFINNGARKLIQRAMPEELREDEELVTRVLADYDVLYGQVYHHTDRAYDGLLDVIRVLHDEMGLRIAVLSNKQDMYVKRLCEAILPKGCYEAAVGVAPGMPTKPDARLTQSVLDTLGVSADECVLVGDSDIDLRTAQNAGLRHIGVTWGFRDEAFLREKGAESFAHTPHELLAMIQEMSR